MNSRPTPSESRHMQRVKELPCGLCGAPPPSAAHHVRQHRHYAVIPLCHACHHGKQGIHGNKTLWRVYKRDELDVLNDTIRRLV